MDKAITAVLEKKKGPIRLSRNSKLFKTIVGAISDKKGEEVIALDLRKIDEAVADFFILCEGKSHIQVAAIAGSVIEKTAEDCSEKPYHVETGEKWTIIDYANVVVHVFQRDSRIFYNLESLWGDAPRFEYT